MCGNYPRSKVQFEVLSTSNIIHNNTELNSAETSDETHGIFSISNLAKWADCNVFLTNLKSQKSSPTGDDTDATDQPGLKEMTLKAIDILDTHAKSNNAKSKEKKDGKDWFLMSEAASIDKLS
ncbi:hypothetical protein M422DRAFT_777213 [Sphaerobolus stellatus SS14]|nr:hypothetical protein M422DRAFT_777213 [Sphaerobolus stellatus SS14]